MPLLGVLVDGEPISLDAVPPEVLMPEIVSALKPDPGRHEEAVHIADLGVCPYKKKMERTLGYYLPVPAAYRMIRGKGWDCLIEKHARPHAIYHNRFWKDFDGIPITGEPDLIDLDLKTIEDYKAPTKDNTKGAVYPSYAWQCNGYLWLTDEYLREKHGVEIESMCLNTVGPTIPVRIPVPMWSPRVLEMEMGRRLNEYLRVMEEDYLGPCGRDDCIFCKQDAYWVELPSQNEDAHLTNQG